MKVSELYAELGLLDLLSASAAKIERRFKGVVAGMDSEAALGLDHRQLDTALDRAERQLQLFDGESVEAELEADGSAVAAEVRIAERHLRSVAGERAEATLDADGGPLEAAADQATRRLGHLDGERPTARLDADDSALDAAARQAERTLERVANGDYTAQLDVEVGGGGAGGDGGGGSILAMVGGWKTAGVAAAAAGGLYVGHKFVEGFTTAVGQEVATDQAAANLLLDPVQAERAGNVAGSLYAQAYGDSVEGNTAAVEAVMSTFAGMRDASEEELSAVTIQAMRVAQAMELDVANAAMVAQVAITGGLAGTATEAFDLMTTGVSKVPAALRGDFAEALHEYVPFLAELGYTGEEAFAVIADSASKGKFSLDKSGDALKEFQIRATDMSATSVEAYEAIGLNAETMSRRIAEGGDGARDAFTQIVDGLMAIDDPVKQRTAAVGLFGTQFEDLANIDAIAALRPMTEGFESVAGSTDRAVAQANDNLGTRLEEMKRTAEQKLVGWMEGTAIPGVEAAWAKVAPIVGSAGDEVKERLAGVRGWAESSFLPGWERVWKRASEVGAPIVDTLATEVVPRIEETFDKVAETIGPILGDIADRVGPIISDIGSSISDGLGNVLTWVEEHWPQIEGTITTVLDAVQLQIEIVLGIISFIWDAFGNNIMGIVEAAWEFIKTTIGAAMKIIGGIIETVMALITGDWGGAWDGIKNILAGVWDAIVGVVSFAISLVWNVLQGVGSFLHDLLGVPFEAVKNFIGDRIEEVVGFFTGLPERIGAAVSGMWDGISDAFKAAINWIIDAWNNLSFTFPSIDGDWNGPLPGGEFTIGGWTIDTKALQIPRLAVGGLVTSPTLAWVGEGRDDEIVSPVPMMRQVVREEMAMAGVGGRGGGPEHWTVEVPIYIGPDQVGRAMASDSDWRTRP